jgi:hypothetical protein
MDISPHPKKNKIRIVVYSPEANGTNFLHFAISEDGGKFLSAGSTHLELLTT